MIPSIDNKTRRSLIEEMNIPLAFADAKFSLIQDPVVARLVQKYAQNMEEYVNRGVGIIFGGERGVGKTSASVYLAKAARTTLTVANNFLTVYFIRSFDLRDVFKTKKIKDYESEVTIFDHCRNVDFLIIDNITNEDCKNVWPGLSGDVFLSDLIAARIQNGKATIFTTSLQKEEFKTKFPELYRAIQGSVIFAAIKGVNSREKKAEDLFNEFKA